MIMSISRLANDRARRRENRIRQLEQERNQREVAVFQRIPQLGEIQRIQSEIGLDLARLLLKVPTRFRKSFEELQVWSLALSNERAQLLKQHNVEPAELEMKWDCPLCRNTGWMEPEPAGPDTVRPPRKCQCLIQEEVEDLYRASGLTGPLRNQTFDRFDSSVYPTGDRDYMEKVLRFCQAYAQAVVGGVQQECLALSGDVGLGKTFLASAIARVVLESKKTVVYFTFSDFLDLVRLNKFEDDEDYRQGMQRLLNSDLVVLDDLGAEKVTEFVGQELFNIINHRMNRQLPMVVSTNLTPSEITDSYGPRIASRLINGFKWLPLRGEDVRWVLRRRTMQ